MNSALAVAIGLTLLRPDCLSGWGQCRLGSSDDKCRCHRPGPPPSRFLLSRHRRFHRHGPQRKAPPDSLRIPDRTGSRSYVLRRYAGDEIMRNTSDHDSKTAFMTLEIWQKPRILTLKSKFLLALRVNA